MFSTTAYAQNDNTGEPVEIILINGLELGVKLKIPVLSRCLMLVAKIFHKL